MNTEPEREPQNSQSMIAEHGSTIKNASQRIINITINHPVVALIVGGVSFLCFFLLINNRLASLIPTRPTSMVGDLRIAVAGFTVTGETAPEDLGVSIAQSLAANITQGLDDLDFEFSYVVWGPDQVGLITGKDNITRAQQARAIAEQVNATVVIYGVIDAAKPVWHVVPEFYLMDLSFTDATELDVSGEHQFGNGFSVPGYGDTGSQIRLTSELAKRARVLSKLMIGLAFYATRDYERAYREFEELESSGIWEQSIGGEQLLYLLLGNAAGRNGDIDQAESHYKVSLETEPQYSRALAGLGNVYFKRALAPGDPDVSLAETDLELVEKSIAYYEQALAARQPALSDMPAKIHFGLGQAYLLRSYADEHVMVAPAIPEFEAVIDAYGDGANPRLKELAAESYMRLGAIYDAGGTKEAAIEFYQRAIGLFDELGSFERQHVAEERLESLLDP